MTELYQEIILDHFKNPHNTGVLDGKKNVKNKKKENIGCGDIITVYIELDESGEKIEHIKWQGTGCAISMASMSVLSDHIKSKSGKQIREIKKTDMLEMLGMEEISISREKCLLLGLKAVQLILEEK